jgi:transposase
MDPHKRSVTIEVMGADETVLGGGRLATDRDGYAAVLRYGRQWPSGVWAIEGCAGIGRHVALRLLRDGEQVVDVPPKLSARARVFATGQGRKTDATDAHSVALVATRMTGLRPVVDHEQLAVLRILVDRRRSLGEDHTRMVSQLHRLLLELIPGGAKKDLSAAQATALLAKVRPRDAAGRARRRVAAELIADLERIYQRKKAANKELQELVAATGTTLMDLHGIGPSGAARVLMATVQLRNPTEGRAYFDRRKAAGKTSMEAMRCLKRRLSDIVYRHLVDDAITHSVTGPGGHRGTTTDSNVTGSHPHTGSSEKSLPGPASNDPTPTATSKPVQPRLRVAHGVARRFATAPVTRPTVGASTPSAWP